MNKLIVMMLFIGCLGGCYQGISLPSKSRQRYSCDTQMPIPGHGSLKQRFVVELREYSMMISLLKSNQANNNSEIYSYISITEKSAEGINSNGVTAVVTYPDATLKMNMKGSTVAITGICKELHSNPEFSM